MSFVIYDGNSRELEAHEEDGFQNLRDQDGNICPMFRITSRNRAEKENQDSLAAHEQRMSRRRIPQSASPIVDLLLELQRLMFYPGYPSRQHSLFANLGGYQQRILNEYPESHVFLVLPHESASVSISGIMDFKVPDPEQLCVFVQEALRSRFSGSQSIDLRQLAESKSKYPKEDYIYHHRLAELMELFGSWFQSEPDDVPELSFVLRFWRASFLAKDGICAVAGSGQEAVIQGPVRYVEMDGE